ncbi:MAG TPA: PAS domain S-box protein [Anaerolineales bacterium]|nr:PAS domain S-box protein [Anaerolineales bacterium]
MEHAATSPFLDSIKRYRLWIRVSLVAAAFGLYLGVFQLFGGLAGIGLLSLSALPVLAAGWIFGTSGGVISFLLAFAFNVNEIASWSGVPVIPDAVIRTGNLAGSAVLLAIGLGGAWLSRLHGEVLDDRRRKDRANDWLKQSEARYRTLFENAPVGLGVTDERGVLVAYNAEMLRPGGHTPADIDALESVADLYYDPADRQTVLRKLAENNQVRNLEIRFKRKNGDPYHARLSVIPIDYGGQAGRLAIIADITEEVHARSELLRSERRFRSLIENSRDVIALIDEKGTILEESLGVVAVLEYTPEELVGKNVFDTIHPDDRENAAGLFSEILVEPGAMRTSQVRALRKDGSPVWVEAIGKNLLTDPDVGAVVVNYRDVSHIVQANKDLVEREQFLSLLNEITALALAATGLTPSLQILVEALAGLLNADACYLTFWSEAAQLPVPMAASGPLKDSYPAMRLRPGEKTFTESILQADCPVVIENVFASDLVSSSVVEHFPNQAVLGLPMKAGERKIGALLVGYDDPARLTAREVHLGEQVGAQIALAINKIQLLEETRRRADQLEKLYMLSRTLNEQQDLKALLHQIAEIAAGLLEANGGAIYLYDGKADNLVIEVSTMDFIPVGTRLERGEGMAGRVFDAREGMILEDYSAWEDRAAPYARLPFRAVVEVPLIYAGEVLGVLAVYQIGDSRRTYTRSDEHLLSLFASQAAGAVHNARLYENLERTNHELFRAYDTTLEGWARALDLRDSPTEGHTKRVAEMTLRLARAIGIGREDLDHIRRGALLHDIGKMSIPDHILLKEGPLDESEWEVMKLHPVFALEFIRPVDFLEPALDIPYCHHECWDGSGYPRGLQGEEIPIAARIFAVVDAWDALRTDRPYRPAWPDRDVIEHLRRESGFRFDPDIVDTFIKLLGENRTP